MDLTAGFVGLVGKQCFPLSEGQMTRNNTWLRLYQPVNFPFFLVNMRGSAQIPLFHEYASKISTVLTSFVIGSTPGQTDRLTVRFSFIFSCASICLSACRCNKQGSASLVCNQYTGRCSCKLSVRGRRCDECPVKSYGFPTCLGEFQESSLLNQTAN